jgi:hypothetical protein
VDIYCANHRIPGTNLEQDALHFLVDYEQFSREMVSLASFTADNLTPISIEPGSACFLLGGRSSLMKELTRLGGQERFQVLTSSNGTGLGIAIRTHIHAADKSGRVKSAFKGLFMKKPKTPSLSLFSKSPQEQQRISNEYVSRKSREDYNSFLRKTLTMIMVFNANTDGIQFDQGEVIRTNINGNITLEEVGRELARYLGNQGEKKVQERREIIDNMFPF